MPVQRNEVDVAWAAGLFEGEGYWNVYVRKSGKKQIQAGLGMTDEDVVERFARIIGFGSVRRSNSAVHASLGWKPLYTWRVYEATKVRELVALLLPYLGERRRAKALDVLDQGVHIQPHAAKKTHCPQGHVLAGENLSFERIQRAGRDYVARRCKTCRRDQARERMRRKAQAL